MGSHSCIYCFHESSSGDMFCQSCGGKIPSTEDERVITHYFRKGYSYKTILQFLQEHHGFKMSLRTLKTRLKQFGLQRKNNLTNELTRRMKLAIVDELQGPGGKSGYRSMWDRLRLFHGTTVPRNAVMVALREIDPEGSAERKRRKLSRRVYSTLGPNHCWHIDGYDKLKPYGFPIHGCIDGYSRKILWLCVVHSNNDPSVIARLFLECINTYGGCPLRIRSDCGSENVALAAIQCYLRRNHQDDFAGLSSHIYGTSPSNQRIEAWWSFYRRSRSSWIMDFYKDMIDNDEFNPSDELEKACMRYCFTPLLQADLDNVAEHWNSHYIRKSNHETLSGRPDEMYFFPGNSGGEDQLQDYDQNDIEEVRDSVGLDDDDSAEDQSYIEYFDYLLAYLDISFPVEWNSCKNTFRLLMHYAR